MIDFNEGQAQVSISHQSKGHGSYSIITTVRVGHTDKEFSISSNDSWIIDQITELQDRKSRTETFLRYYPELNELIESTIEDLTDEIALARTAFEAEFDGSTLLVEVASIVEYAESKGITFESAVESVQTEFCRGLADKNPGRAGWWAFEK